MLAIKATSDPAIHVRLVSVLQRAVAATVGEQAMSVAIEGQIAKALGTLAASITHRHKAAGDELVAKLRRAMPEGTADGDRCMQGYFERLSNNGGD